MKASCLLRARVWLVLLAALAVAPSASGDVVVTYAGSQTDLGPGWRRSSVSKPLDLDGDNVLGTDGYFIVNRPAVQPNYVGVMQSVTNIYPGNANYAQIDDPTTSGNVFTTGTLNPFPGKGGDQILFAFGLNSNAIGRTIRVGLMVDNLDSTNYNGGCLFIQQANGDNPASSGLLWTTSLVYNDRNPDWIFIDIAGAAEGDLFEVHGLGGFAGAATLAAVTFDSLTNFIVTTTNDAGAGSLRGLATAAPAGTTLTFATNLSGAAITLTNGEILLTASGLTIDASALSGGITINGNAASRVFEIASSATVALTSLTFTNGHASAGGAILNAGSLTMNRSTITGSSVSSGGGGGGIYNNWGMLTLNECTIAGNSANLGGGAGGGIFNLTEGAPVILNQCTVSGNVANTGGGVAGFSFGSINVSLFNSIVAGNGAGSQPDITTNITPLLTGANLVGGNPLLFSLGNHGGPTPTMPPLAGSPAIDAGSDSATNSFATDQRGLPRLGAAHVDIGAVESQILVVTNNADTGPGSLRSAVAAATTYANIITFAPGLSGQTIQFSNGVILISHTLDIDASALPGGITLDGRNASRIFEVDTGNVVLNALTLTKGQAGTGSGGAIYNADILTLSACTLAGNSAANGGGLVNLGTLTLNECTVAGNSVNGTGGFTAPGGGILNFGTLTLNECTLANNVAANGGAIYNGDNLALNHSTLTANLANGGSGGGGGVYNAGTLTVANSIVAGNSEAIGNDIYGPAAYTGVNLTNGNPLLLQLGNYGGPTTTMPPMFGSPAIDACTSGTSFVTDQRGFQRIAGPFADIGAVEFQDASPIVTTNLDAGVGSLRYALTYTPGGSTITFDSSLSGASILLTNGEILLTKDLTVDASMLPGGITIDGHGNGRIFEVAPNVTVVLNRLNIANGVDVSGQGGGGVFNSGRLTINRSTLMNNQTWDGTYAQGGAIFNNAGMLVLNECTLVGNNSWTQDGGYGGGIFNLSGAVTLNQCTLTDNSAGVAGGGIYNTGTLTVDNSIVAGNSEAIGIDIFGPATYTGVNLTYGNLLLAPLGNYGGPTPTMPPLPGSPAIDGCTNGIAPALTTDQRGYPRVLGLYADLGAVEGVYNPAGPGILTGMNRVPNGAASFNFTNFSDMSFSVLATTSLAWPLNTWTYLGGALESPAGSGHYQFTDPQATNSPQRFYRVSWP